MLVKRVSALIALTLLWSQVCAAGATEFCLEGEFDLGARYQGTLPTAGEFYPTTWCVITEDDSDRVWFSGTGRSNPDMDGNWTVVYLPPDTVRIVNQDAAPDIEFRGTNNAAEARRVRRLDPRRLMQEKQLTQPLPSLKMQTDLPLRGRVDVEWTWGWDNASAPQVQLVVDDVVFFKATGRWRDVAESEAELLWQATPGAEPVQVPGERWPARVNMELINLTDDLYLVRGVRTGFQHLVIDTAKGLVVADAPAGWVEFHHLPPSDLVPGLGVSGLSEKFIAFLEKELPGRPVYAVALTHFHDDHAGGAGAFAAAGAKIYAPGGSAGFIADALGTDVIPVNDAIGIVDGVSLLPMGGGPHVDDMLGVWVVDKDYFFVSDVHVPNSDAEMPREGREKTECWFAAWAVSHLSADVRVANSHSAPITPVSRLARYLESDACRD